ncbi:MAG: ABC transporter ATP-binding protein [bacterium]|nr:ABC transporter ATP-binding protein [bacterium]
MPHLLEVRNLITRFDVEDGIVHAVNSISYALNEGESMAIVGESGSGKSVGVHSVMGLVPTPPGRVERGEVLYNGQDLLRLSQEAMRSVRGKEIAMIFQDPMTSLNPVLTIGLQITEVLQEHLKLSRQQANKRTAELLAMVGIPNAEDRLKDYPHQFSGGQRQRIGIAMALACDPALLIADEPTTALDVTVQAQIMELASELKQKLGMAIIWITHDLGVVAGLVEKVFVMYAGCIVEMAPVRQLYKETSHPYTLGLLESIPTLEATEERLIPIEGNPPDLLKEPVSCPFAPRCRFAVERCWQEIPPLQNVGTEHFSACWFWEEARKYQPEQEKVMIGVVLPKREPSSDEEILVQVRELKKHFPIMRGIIKRQVGAVKAVDGVTFDIKKGETLGLVGESGCGKSTTGQTILRLLTPTDGEVIFDGQDIAQLDKERLRQTRRHMQMVFQDPYASLNPRMTVGTIISEPLWIHGFGDRNRRIARVKELLDLVGLNPNFVNRFPHEFSGGQRQRIGIARALATNPSFIVADEPIAALDVSIQAQVVNLLDDLRKELGLTYLFIAHDLSMVRYISDRVAVMYLGRIAELGLQNDVYEHPLHPYTQALLSANPIPDPDVEAERQRIVLQGNVPNPANPPSGCRFHTRCIHATGLCSQKDPEFRNLGDPGQIHMVACHHAEKFMRQAQ